MFCIAPLRLVSNPVILAFEAVRNETGRSIPFGLAPQTARPTHNTMARVIV